MLRFAVLCAVLAAAATAAPSKTELAAAVGERLKLCGRSRSDYNECMKERLEQLLPELAETGIPEVGVPRGEPTEIPEMTVHYRNGNMSADLRIRNSRTWGAAGLKIRSVKSIVNDPEVFRFEVGYYMPRIFTEGDYKVDARLVVPIITKGYYNITMTDVTGVWEVTGEHYKKRGQDFVRITSFKMLPEVGDMRIYASNLVPGNPELSEYLLALANQYWLPLYEQLLPDTNEAWGQIVVERMNRVFNKVPFDAMFPLE
ncbi:hypothetical protein R5R35_006677 [Gryllus longicercus]|uniref:Uncharacterized protein n=1 Tax=Gryllus longicercus TaxID=2509291 RepID=A0AAN9VXZ8_9ORTH